MRFKTRDLELSQALDEVFLRLSLMGLRVFQVAFSVPIIGFVAALISGLSNAGLDVPSRASAAIAIACVCAVYASVTLLPIVFEGPLFFLIASIFDLLFIAAWSSLIGVWACDGTATCTTFKAKYFGARPQKPYFSTDCRLVKAMFAFMVILLASFVSSTVISLCLRMIELQHSVSWRSLPLFNKHNGPQRHCSCCNHDKLHPSPPSSVNGDNPRYTV